MKLKLDSVLLNADDTPAKEGEKDVTLRSALIRAVLAEYDDNMQPVKGPEKIQRYDLYRKVKKGTEETDFSPEEVVLMRKASLVFAPLSAGQIHEHLS
jgi:hypothetical protein